MTDNVRRRLRNLIKLLGSQPDTGLTTPEIAEYLGVTRQTAWADIVRLEEDGIPLYQDGDHYFLDINYFHELHLSLAEAWFLYLPLRRLIRAGLGRIPLVRQLLENVTSLLHEELATLLSDTATDEAIELEKVFVTLVKGWHDKKLVEIVYHRPNSTQDTRLLVAPWWIEPAVWSDAFYLIGGLQTSDGQAAPVTLKIDRIHSVHLLPTRFERPLAIEIARMVEQTWGIWTTETEAVRVCLRFHNRQYDRLRETRWHPSQQISLDAEGYVIWEAELSEPQEMLPWIRGWGADVEVIEPANIREQVAYSAAATVKLYGLNSVDPSDLL